ncbi:367_t:CDS:1, partial [Racocetra fulgida]
KLKLLHRISDGLILVHDNQIIYSGNILISQNIEPTISYLGISKPANESLDNSSIYGIVPYVAPEVLKGGKFTALSDIYSLV